jgi:hypothetical protein
VRGHLDLRHRAAAPAGEIAPDIVLKMKFDWPPVIGNAPAVPFQTMPVGPPATVTTVLLTAPVAGRMIAVFVPLLAGHHGEVGLLTSPHGFLRFASKRSAGTAAELETRLRTTY